MIDLKKLEELKDYCVVNNLDFDKTLTKIFDIGFNYIKYKDYIPEKKKVEKVKILESPIEIKVDSINMGEEAPQPKPFIPKDSYGE